ncbi:MAG: hypothetical protein WD716_12210 [Fimbriimonadaceae bacterium]
MKRSRQVAWVVAVSVLAVGGFIAVQVLGQYGRMHDDAQAACRQYLEERLGGTVDIAALQTSSILTVYPEPPRKRFRTTCTYGGVSVELESKPFQPWTVVGTTGLD